MQMSRVQLLLGIAAFQVAQADDVCAFRARYRQPMRAHDRMRSEFKLRKRYSGDAMTQTRSCNLATTSIKVN